MNVGDKVFDLPSQQVVTITRRRGKFINTTAPLDPTGDGAFPDGWRRITEVCAVDDTETQNKPFRY